MRMKSKILTFISILTLLIALSAGFAAVPAVAAPYFTVVSVSFRSKINLAPVKPDIDVEEPELTADQLEEDIPEIEEPVNDPSDEEDVLPEEPVEPEDPEEDEGSDEPEETVTEPGEDEDDTPAPDEPADSEEPDNPESPESDEAEVIDELPPSGDLG